MGGRGDGLCGSCLMELPLDSAQLVPGVALHAPLEPEGRAGQGEVALARCAGFPGSKLGYQRRGQESHRGQLIGKDGVDRGFGDAVPWIHDDAMLGPVPGGAVGVGRGLVNPNRGQAVVPNANPVRRFRSTVWRPRAQSLAVIHEVLEDDQLDIAALEDLGADGVIALGLPTLDNDILEQNRARIDEDRRGIAKGPTQVAAPFVGVVEVALELGVPGEVGCAGGEEAGVDQAAVFAGLDGAASRGDVVGGEEQQGEDEG